MQKVSDGARGLRTIVCAGFSKRRRCRSRATRPRALSPRGTPKLYARPSPHAFPGSPISAAHVERYLIVALGLFLVRPRRTIVLDGRVVPVAGHASAVAQLAVLDVRGADVRRTAVYHSV